MNHFPQNKFPNYPNCYKTIEHKRFLKDHCMLSSNNFYFSTHRHDFFAIQEIWSRQSEEKIALTVKHASVKTMLK